MIVRCLSCRLEHPPSAQVCPGCGTKRDLPKRLQKGVQLRPKILVMPSRNRNNPHVLDVGADRKVACTSCRASLHGRLCWAADSLQRRLDRHKTKILRDLLTTKELVYAVLADHPEARDADIDFIIAYFRDWHDVPESATWIDVMELQRREYGSFWMDRLVRVRAHLQNREGYWPPCDLTVRARRLHEKVYNDHFAANAGASA